MAVAIVPSRPARHCTIIPFPSERCRQPASCLPTPVDKAARLVEMLEGLMASPPADRPAHLQPLGRLLERKLAAAN